MTIYPATATQPSGASRPRDGAGWIDPVASTRITPVELLETREPDAFLLLMAEVEAAGAAADIATADSAASLDDAGDRLVSVVAALDRVTAHVAAVRARVLADLVRATAVPTVSSAGKSSGAARGAAGALADPCVLVGYEVAPVLRVAPTTAIGYVQDAVQLVEDLPATWTALREGAITPAHAKVACDTLTPLRDHRLRGLAESEVLDRARSGAGPGQLRRAAERVVSRIDAAAVRERMRRARADRDVWAHHRLDGVSEVTAVLPSEHASALMTTLNAAATALRQEDQATQHQRGEHHTPAHASGNGHASDGTNTSDGANAVVDDTSTAAPDNAASDNAASDSAAWTPRSMAQCRADALALMAWTALRTGRIGDAAGNPSPRGNRDASGATPDDYSPGVHLAERRGRPVTVHVTVPYSSLLGLDEDPVHLPGAGPIPADAARRLAGQGVWRRLLTDPVDGALLDYGTTRYTPPTDLAQAVETRDRTCRFPTCSHPAAWSQLDHTVPFGHRAPARPAPASPTVAAASPTTATPATATPTTASPTTASPAAPSRNANDPPAEQRTTGGTSYTNLGALSHRCHQMKTHGGWQLSQPTPGQFVWTSPRGRRYTVRPEPIGPPRRTSTDPPSSGASTRSSDGGPEERARPEPRSSEQPGDDPPASSDDVLRTSRENPSSRTQRERDDPWVVGDPDAGWPF